jgi:hypothetical protein
MEESEFKNRYRLIVFAILDDHNAHQNHNPEGNFKPFADEFAEMDRPKLTEEYGGDASKYWDKAFRI